jgi:hypothetical protein
MILRLANQKLGSAIPERYRSPPEWRHENVMKNTTLSD